MLSIIESVERFGLSKPKKPSTVNPPKQALKELKRIKTSHKSPIQREVEAELLDIYTTMNLVQRNK